MTILYRTSGAWGAGVGANLTATQVDNNFYDLHGRVQFMELNPPTPIQISSFSSIGNRFYIHMTDGTTNGPFTLPTVRWYYRGDWLPSTSYNVDDIVIGPDSAVYLVVRAHVSKATFSPGADDGEGHRYYSLLLQTPASTIPGGGGRGYVLTKKTDKSYDLIWNPAGVPAGGNTGAVLQKNSAQDGDATWNQVLIDELGDVEIYGTLKDGDYLQWNEAAEQWVNQARPMFNVLRGTSWAPVLGQEGSFMVLTNGAADATVTIPHDGRINFALGTELHIHQDGTGDVTVNGDPGVLIRKHQSFSNKLLGQYATVTVKKTWPNEWRLFGLLAGA